MWALLATSLACLAAAHVSLRVGQPGASADANFVVQVFASSETDPVSDKGDAADDACIWVHPTDASQSLIIGTNKVRGLVIFGLDGKTRQKIPHGHLNNVDVQYGFSLNGQSVDIVCSENRTTNMILVYRVNPATRRLIRIDNGSVRPKGPVYGCCLYRSPASGKHYVFVGSKTGVVEQWELRDAGEGAVSGRLARRIDVGSSVEGCVADVEFGHLYVAEEMVGIWKYPAEPTDQTPRRAVDLTSDPNGYVKPQVEGLTIYYASNGKGYLIASSQRNDEFVIYRREADNQYVATFEIVGSNWIDKVTHTDGIDVVSCNLGARFPAGVFVAQDHRNGKGNQNFKLVPWQEIAEALSPAVTVDTSWTPRVAKPERPRSNTTR